MLLEICLDEDLDSFLTGMHSDAHGRIAKIAFMPATVLSSDSRVRHPALLVSTGHKACTRRRTVLSSGTRPDAANHSSMSRTSSPWLAGMPSS
jgi:hypothetical protein